MRTVAFTFNKLIRFNSSPSHGVLPEEFFNSPFGLIHLAEFPPLEESVGGNDAATLLQCSPEGGFFCQCFSVGVDHTVAIAGSFAHWIQSARTETGSAADSPEKLLVSVATAVIE